MTATDRALLETSSLLFAGILASGRKLTAEEAVLTRWATIYTARQMLQEITEAEPQGLDVGAFVQAHRGTGSIFRSFEQRVVEEALDQTNGNVTRAAKLLGIGRTTMCAKKRKAARG
jgi:transcriptional regulator with PAS, ATPase and Fis domain